MELDLELVNLHKTGVDKNQIVDVRISYFIYDRLKTEIIYYRVFIFKFLGTCSVLQSPLNGDISYNKDKVGGRYPVNTKASFSCNSGYNRNGHSSRICQSAGNWNHQTPTCNPGNEIQA